MTANNQTSATQSLQPVAESMEVVLARIHGLVERDSQGVFVQTERGKKLQIILSNVPPEKQDEVAVVFLFPTTVWSELKSASVNKV